MAVFRRRWLGNQAQRALMRAGRVLMQDAAATFYLYCLEEVPVRTGYLRSTHYARMASTGVGFEVGATAYYAVFVHARNPWMARAADRLRSEFDTFVIHT